MEDLVDRRIPLCVDLDGTLIHSDLLHESFLTLLRERPLDALRAPFWLLLGKARLQAEIAARVDLGQIKLPFRDDVVRYVASERKLRPTVLVTAGHQSLAEAVAKRCDLFDEVRGSDESLNLTGRQRRDWLVSRFGQQGFDYIGNDRDDLPAWSAAREALAVSGSDGVDRNTSINFSRLFASSSPGINDYVGMMRIHHWSKNFLIAIPFLLAQRFDDPQATFAVLLGIVVMCLLASATYVFNDLLDLQSDRQSGRKQSRALSSGRIPISHGATTVLLLGTAALILSALLPSPFRATLLVYLVLTLSYSFCLKRYAMIDVITLATLHTLRIVAGMLVIDAEWSFWLLAFAMFLFLSLALAKRVAELVNLERAGHHQAIGRGYTVSDRQLLTMTGVVAGYLSTLVFVLYINSDKVLRAYGEPQILWLVCPVLMYWIGHIWLTTDRGLMNEDPIVFAFEDRASIVTIIVLGGVVAMALFL